MREEKQHRIAIITRPVPGVFMPPLYWTGRGWSAQPAEAERFKDTIAADARINRMLDDRLLRNLQPAYDLRAGAKLERVVI